MSEVPDLLAKLQEAVNAAKRDRAADRNTTPHREAHAMTEAAHPPHDPAASAADEED